MATTNPFTVDIPVDTWVKVATAVKSGLVFVVETGAIYYSTYRVFGGTAPTVLPDEGVRLRNPGAKISAKDIIDVYIYAQRTDGKVQVHI